MLDIYLKAIKFVGLVIILGIVIALTLNLIADGRTPVVEPDNEICSDSTDPLVYNEESFDTTACSVNSDIPAQPTDAGVWLAE